MKYFEEKKEADCNNEQTIGGRVYRDRRGFMVVRP